MIDPVARQAFLTASNPGENDEFGFSVAISGDTIVVGAPSEDSNTNTVNSVPNEGASAAGAAYVFVRADGAWSQQAYLKAANSGPTDHCSKATRPLSRSPRLLSMLKAKE